MKFQFIAKLKNGQQLETDNLRDTLRRVLAETKARKFYVMEYRDGCFSRILMGSEDTSGECLCKDFTREEATQFLAN